MDDIVNDKDEYTTPSHNTNCFCSTIFCKLTNEDFDETCQKKLPPITMSSGYINMRRIFNVIIIREFV